MKPDQHGIQVSAFASELSVQMALRQRQFAAITNLLRVSEIMPVVSPLLKRESYESISKLSTSIGVHHVLSPALEEMASLQSDKMLEDATHLAITGAVVLTHSVFEDLLHFAADLSYRANPLWWKSAVFSISTTTYSLKEYEENGFNKLLADEENSFIKRWKSKSLINKVDSFLSVHRPKKTSYGDEVSFQREALVSIDDLRHKIVHEDVFTSKDDQVVSDIFGVIDSGRFIHRLLAEPEWIGFDSDTLLKSTPTMTGVSDDTMSELASTITLNFLEQVLKKPGVEE